MTDYHEPPEALSDEIRDAHRALTSLREEIEAVDWYHQRVAMCSDEGLAAVLAHNRDEEIEHAAMTLEWLRRRYPVWNDQLRKYLFTEGPITEIEGDGGGGGAPSESLGIGALRAPSTKGGPR